MARLDCDNCGNSTKNGYIVRTCDNCGRMLCSKCCNKGDRCPSCRKGFMR